MMGLETEPDLSGEVRLERSVFSEWVDFGANQSSQCPCAQAVMQYVEGQQGEELRGSVTGDTAWELCCRNLAREEPVHTLGTREVAQLIVYWLDEKALPWSMRDTIYKGMQEDLEKRGKTVQTEADENAMKSRWVRQRVHGELDATREAYIGRSQDTAVDLDVDFDMPEAQQVSLTAESEQEAARLLEELAGTESQECHTASVPGASSRANSDPEHEEPPLRTSQLRVGSGDGSPMIYTPFRPRVICGMVEHSGSSGS